MKKFIITDLAKGNANISADQVLEIGGNSGGTTGDLTLEQARQNGNVLEGDVELNGFANLVFPDEDEYVRVSVGKSQSMDRGGLFQTNLQGLTTGLFFLQNGISLILSSDNPDFVGLTGGNEYDKQGDRNAFAQISDVQDAVSYSTEEIKTGGYFEDENGVKKPVYRKLFHLEIDNSFGGIDIHNYQPIISEDYFDYLNIENVINQKSEFKNLVFDNTIIVNELGEEYNSLANNASMLLSTSFYNSINVIRNINASGFKSFTLDTYFLPLFNFLSVGINIYDINGKSGTISPIGGKCTLFLEYTKTTSE